MANKIYNFYKEIYFHAMGIVRGAQWEIAGAEFYFGLIIIFLFSAILTFTISFFINSMQISEWYFDIILPSFAGVIMLLEFIFLNVLRYGEKFREDFRKVSDTNKKKYVVNGYLLILGAFFAFILSCILMGFIQYKYQ